MNRLKIFRWLAGAEFRSVVRSGRYVSLVLMCCVLAAAFVASAARAQRLTADQLRDARETATPGVSASPLRVVRSPEAMAIFVRGVDFAVPAAWHFSPAGFQADDPTVATTSISSLDVAFVVRFLVGLLAIMMAVDRVGPAQRSAGLRGLLSQPLGHRMILLSRIGGGAIALAIVCVLVALASALIAGVEHQLGGMDAPLLTLTAFAACSWMYALALYAVGLLVGLVARHDASATAAALSVWVALIVVVPSLTDRLNFDDASARTVSFSEQQRRYDAQALEDERALGNALAGLLRAGETPNEALRRPEVASQLNRQWREQTERRRRLVTELSSPKSVGRSMAAAALTAMSPATLYVDAVTRVVGTGPPLADRWDSVVRARQAALSVALFDNPPRIVVRVNSPSGREIVSMTRQTSVAEPLPPARPQPQSLGRRVMEAGRPVAGLAFMAAVTLAVALWLFSRPA